MNDIKAEAQTKDLVQDYELDAPPEKVWRAISIPALREAWLPNGDLADAAPVSSKPGEEVRYRMRDDEPPFIESIVTIQVRPNAVGGTRLRIIHGPVGASLMLRTPRAANSNLLCVMRAA
jgi:uncharacterized protein YndB with AHSA1/START domain